MLFESIAEDFFLAKIMVRGAELLAVLCRVKSSGLFKQTLNVNDTFLAN